MADAAVEFLLENLKQLLLYHAQLIHDAKAHVEILEEDLRLFKAFLKEYSTKKRNKDETLKEFVRQIRDVCYEAEDVIDSFVTQAADAKSRNYFARTFYGPAKHPGVAEGVQAVGAKVKDIYEKRKFDFATLQADGASGTGAEEETFERIKVPSVREDNIVGFEDEAQTIINYLNEERGELDVISIIGMPGLGKTTLAGKIFRDSKILFEFPVRIWVYVSQEFNRKDVFLAILSNFIKVDDHLRQIPDHEIAKILREQLERLKFLIVMDDVWSAEAWTHLQDAFPKSNKTGKILITSRNEEVARQANRNRDPHKLRLLTHDEGWLLLQLEVFGKPECPDDVTTFGKLIVDRCGRLPLAVVVIGGILIKKGSFGDIGAMKIAWRKISESTNTYLNYDSEKRMEVIISWSYNKLPYYLRPCFLYVGMFPEDFEIPVWKLIRMWIAEGFIQQKTGISLEQAAQDYFEDLINRNLVMVDKVSPDGKIKTCRIHDMLREFCRNEAGNENENFFQEMKSRGGVFEPSVTEIEKFRRLCIHSNIMSFISAKPNGPRVRSFLCFSKEEITLQPENISFIPAAFKLLRVLEAKSLNFQRFPRDLTQLVHLRYITISSNFKVLPEAISKLWNLQTLIVYTSSRILEIKADIWKMVQLRHVKTNASAILPKPNKSSKECEKLQTLGTISHQSCTEDVFNRIRTVSKLGIRGRLATLLDAKGLEKLDNLDRLKLVNEVYPGPASEGPLSGLPQPYKFPPKLRSLTLSATYLDWHNMSTLGLLDALEVLKLKNNAFVGKTWGATDGRFRHLEVLHIERTDLVIWVASGHHFPKLRCLVLRNCEKLLEIPSGLGENLQKLDLKRVSKSAVDSAKKIEEAKMGSGTSKRGGFKLILAPADE